MCGIAATFAYSADAPPVDRDELIAIRDRMAKRGPDGHGLWISDDRRIGLAHRRLSIIDLSEAGAQPMWSADRSLCITYNGEIYNYATLRAELLATGYQFQSHCDTEVILALYAQKGVQMLNDLRGMYAFVIWDARKHSIFAARDPFGIKPLYYSDDGGTIRLASQVKALLESKSISREPEPAGHVAFFIWGSVPDPFTLYRAIKPLPAGYWLALDRSGKLEMHEFCNIPSILRDAELASDGRSIPVAERTEILHASLRDSVDHHLVADVPVGVFQSAGLDSSTITALVSEMHTDVRTVTLGFDEYRGAENDETRLAEVVAKQFETNHQTIRITRHDFEAEAAALFDAMDRPSIDGVNTYFVSLAAKRTGLKVALSGVGGDELFGGYTSFRDVPRMVRMFRPLCPLVPNFAREFRVLTAPVLKRFTSPKYAGVFEYGSNFPGAYLLRRSLFMPWELPHILDPELVREGWRDLHTLPQLGRFCDGLRSSRLKVSSLELCWYMRHQLLRDSDWAGMAHSLEIRVPLVDAKMLRTIAPLLASPNPPSKRDMAHSPAAPLPAQILSRPKTGFSVPVRDWLLQSFDPTPGHERGLRGWAREVYSRFVDPTVMHARTMKGKKSRKAKVGSRKGDEVRNSNLEMRNGQGSRAGEIAAPFRTPQSDLTSIAHSEEGIRNSAPPLRALVLLSDAFGGFGGIAKFNRDFIGALCAHDRLEEVIVLPRLMPNEPEPLPAKVRMVTEALGGKVNYLKALNHVMRELRTSSDTLLIFCAHINLLPAAALAKRLCGGSVHLIIHGIDAWKPNRNPTIRASLPIIDGFIAVSNVTKQRFQGWTGLRYDQGLLLPNCVDLTHFTPGPRSAALLHRYGLEHSTVLMTLGRLESVERYKGFDQVIEILPRLAEKIPNLTYLICGDGRDRPRLIAKALSLGCVVIDRSGDVRSSSPGDMQSAIRNPQFQQSIGAPRVVFAGRISEKEKVEHYRLAAVYIMPSSGEGFGIVFLEALACGIPVIGSKADGSREALRDGRLGELVDPRDPDEIAEAILRVLVDQSEANCRTNREGLEHFSTQKFQARVHAIVEAIAPVLGEVAVSAADRTGLPVID